MVDPSERLEAVRAIVEHVVPGRWADVRAPSPKELRATLVLRVPLVEASTKTRTGPPLDGEEDYRLPCWAGEIPLKLTPQRAVPNPRLDPRTRLPGFIRSYGRPSANRVRRSGPS